MFSTYIKTTIIKYQENKKEIKKFLSLFYVCTTTTTNKHIQFIDTLNVLMIQQQHNKSREYMGKQSSRKREEKGKLSNKNNHRFNIAIITIKWK